jgi:hypothetical protein
MHALLRFEQTVIAEAHLLDDRAKNAVDERAGKSAD